MPPGNSKSEPAVVMTPEPSEPTAPKKKMSKKAKIAIAAAVVVLIFIIGLLILAAANLRSIVKVIQPKYDTGFTVYSSARNSGLRREKTVLHYTVFQESYPSTLNAPVDAVIQFNQDMTRNSFGNCGPDFRDNSGDVMREKSDSKCSVIATTPNGKKIYAYVSAHNLAVDGYYYTTSGITGIVFEPTPFHQVRTMSEDEKTLTNIKFSRQLTDFIDSYNQVLE